MSTLDLSVTDPAMEVGDQVVRLLAEGYDGEQIAEICSVTVEVALAALTAYATRVLTGVVVEPASAECFIYYNGWCAKHGVFHPGGAA